MVERPTQKPGAVLSRVRVPGAARDFSPRVSFQCRLSYGVRTAPRVQYRMHQQPSKIPNSGSHIALFGHTQILHTPLRYFGGAAPAAYVSFPVKDNEVLKKKKKIKEHLRLEIERLGVETDFAGDFDPSCVVNGHSLILPSTIIISSKDG